MKEILKFFGLIILLSIPFIVALYGFALLILEVVGL